MSRITFFGNTTLALLVVLGALTACQKQNEGPAETAGKQLDQAVDKVKDKASETAEEMGQRIERAGQNIQDAAKNKEP